MEYEGIVALKDNVDPTHIRKQDILFGTPFPTLKLVEAKSGSITFNIDGLGEGSFNEIIGTIPDGLPLPVNIFAMAEYYDSTSDAVTSYYALMPQEFVSASSSLAHAYNIVPTSSGVEFTGSVVGVTPSQSPTLRYRYYLYYDPF